jgi:hypothetical protein
MQTAFRALAMLLALGPAAAAAEATADQAATLQAQVQAALRDQFRGLGGTEAPTVRVRPAGDHYDVTVTVDSQDATATARQTADGAWAVDAIHLPSPATFKFAGPQGGRQVAIDIGTQDARAVSLPGFTMAASFLGHYTAVSVASTGPQGRMVSHIDDWTISGAATKQSNGTIDVTDTLSATGYRVTSHTPDGMDGRIQARRSDLRLKIASLSPAAASAVSGAWARLAAGLYPSLRAGTRPAWDDGTRSAAHDLVLSLDGLLQGLDLAGAADGLSIESAGSALGLAHAGLGLTAAAPQGLLDARLSVELAGLSVSDVPRAQGGDLIPRNLYVQPVLSGVDLQALRRIALSVTAEGSAWPDGFVQLLALLSQGGIGLGLEHIALDVGPAHIAGGLHAQLAGLTTNSGEGRITATGFDALLARMQDVPAAAGLRRALVGLRAAAREEGAALVWDLALKDSRLLVNGTDLATLRQP